MTSLLGHRDIQALGVRCSNVDSGCGWEGTVGTLQDHVTKCDFILVPCPNGCEESESGLILQLLRKELEEHISSQCPKREYQCRDCGRKDEYGVITGLHVSECPKKLVKCPNETCSVSLERCCVPRHVQQSCAYTEVYCKYTSMGCGVKKMRMDMEDHEGSTEHHFPIAMKKITELNILMSRGASTSWSTDNTGPRTIFKLSEYTEKKEKSSPYHFEPFFTSPCGYKMKLVVYPNGFRTSIGTHISVFIHNLHGPYDDQLKWPLNGLFTIELLNQLEDSEHHTETITYKKPGSSWGRAAFLEQSKLALDSYRNVLYLKDDELYFRVTSEVLGYKRWLEHTHQ